MSRATGNGSGTWKIIGIVVTILLFAATVVFGFVYNYGGHDEKVLGIEKDVAVMIPDVKANTDTDSKKR